jgi:Immunity protein 70
LSLYLCVFAGDREIAGVEAGPYADFNALRETIVAELEGGAPGSRFPTFVLHSDCDGEWPVAAVAALAGELASIAAALQARPPRPFFSDWQREAARSRGREPRNACESFVDVDGEFLLERLQGLAEAALREKQPILFQ